MVLIYRPRRGGKHGWPGGYSNLKSMQDPHDHRLPLRMRYTRPVMKNKSGEQALIRAPKIAFSPSSGLLDKTRGVELVPEISSRLAHGVLGLPAGPSREMKTAKTTVGDVRE